ncbi:DUF2842 domain-containing protein [Sphingomicrobium nitratireducens]|uniref:DUF2842 domain-containing protein n=1 Tax=Sphingomicrobium nitratireducens TaxID=2964666 RepID=UPI00223F6106|nr:DUF2842 domain-containing protein [Sphingomicrobium nitratireducens]
MTPEHQPNPRQLVGMAGIVVWIIAWTAAIVSFADAISSWPVLIQALFYLVAGLVWILPLKRVLMWMETGRFRS